MLHSKSEALACEDFSFPKEKGSAYVVSGFPFPFIFLGPRSRKPEKARYHYHEICARQPLVEQLLDKFVHLFGGKFELLPKLRLFLLVELPCQLVYDKLLQFEIILRHY